MSATAGGPRAPLTRQSGQPGGGGEAGGVPVAPHIRAPIHVQYVPRREVDEHRATGRQQPSRRKVSGEAIKVAYREAIAHLRFDRATTY